MVFSAFLVSLLVLAKVRTTTSVVIELDRSVVSATLPKAISDHTAVLGDDNLIYVAGGCDDPNGNTWNEEWETFACGSISSSLFSFNPETSEVATLPDMPRGRYRHAAVSVGDELWIAGGRSLEDSLLEEVDVFNTASQTWATYTLPAGYASSDLAGWATDTHAFFAGGYDANYTALAKVYSIDVAASVADNLLAIEDKDDLKTARGDVAATVNIEKGYAYASGGFTHEDGFCAALESVERYSLAGDTWISVASLPTARADKAMVTYNSHTIALGGEKAPDNSCSGEPLTPAEKSEAVDDIEVLNDDDTTWQILAELPENRFRFAAAVHKDSIYAFGGQQSFDSECNCLKTTNEIVAFKINEVTTVDENQANADDTDQASDMESGIDEAATADGASGAFTFRAASISLFSLLIGSLWIV